MMTRLLVHVVGKIVKSYKAVSGKLSKLAASRH